MIKGKSRIVLNKESILRKITPYDIYRYYQGPFTLNHVINNKFRGEKTPSLIIGNKVRTTLSHKDFGDSKWKGDCFDFVQQIHNCNYDNALKIIDRDFNLGMVSQSVSHKQIITWKNPITLVKPPPLFNVVPRKMTKDEWNYWGCYHQGEEDIKREYIYVPAEIWRNKRKMYLGNLMTFCYYFPSIDRWKLYRPFAPPRDNDSPPCMWKWDTNVPFDYVEDLENVRDADLGVLGKSKKDRMVLRKALELNTIANVQAEDAACMSKESLDVFDTCKRKLAVTDNDKKGKEFSWWLTDNFGYRHCNVPDKEKLCTDFADMSCVYKSLDVVKQHFKRKRFI